MKVSYPAFNYHWTKLVVLLLVAIQLHEVISFMQEVAASKKVEAKSFGEKVFAYKAKHSKIYQRELRRMK